MWDSKYNNGNIKLYDYNNNYVVDVMVKTIVEDAIKANKTTSEGANNYILQNRYIYIDELQTLYITNMYITYDNSTNEVMYMSLSGNLLKKD